MARCCNTSGAACCGEDSANEYINCRKGPPCQVSSHCTTSLLPLSYFKQSSVCKLSTVAPKLPCEYL